jgi:phosphatidylglycerol:prolipoprotein diacylglycerol transferase
MIDFTPNPVALALQIGSFGPIEVRWYGIGYVAAIMAGTWLAYRLARKRGERTDMIVDSLIVMAIAALIGGRAYHVIDQWSTGPDYKDHLANIFLPPYSGLGIYGGLFTGLLAVIWLTRHYKLSFWRWGDIIAPCVLLAQAVGRWGNFMNQELYGPPTNLPWGIAIQCQYRVAEYHCPGWPGVGVPTAVDAHFIPLFFYESVLSLIGVFALILLWRRFTARGRLLIVGDVGLLYFVWYGVERSVLETFRGGWNWTLHLLEVHVGPFGFGGVDLATAQIVGISAAIAAVVAILIRHRWVRSHPLATVAVVEGGAEVVEPAASAEASEPTVAAESGEPTASSAPTVAAESAGQTAPSAPTQSGLLGRLKALMPKSTPKPAEPVGPAESVEPAEQVETAEPATPADATEPAKPAKNPRASKAKPKE